MTTRRGYVRRVLKENIGERGTDALVQCVDISIAENNKHMYNLHIRPLTKIIDTLAKGQAEMKQDLAKIKQDQAGMKQDQAGMKQDQAEMKQTQTTMKEEIDALRVEMREGFAKEREERKEGLSKLELNMMRIKGELEVKIADCRSDVLRWMFAFFITMLLALIGLYFKK